jgi:hypothetical protein
MKTFIYLLMGMLSTGCALAQPSASKFTVRVLDSETGHPVTNATVQAIFEHQYDPWGNKPNIVDRRNEPVDLNGEVVFEGKCIHGGAGGTAFAEGYYSGHEGQSSTKNIALNRWEPWNPTIEVKMRKIKNPVSMKYKRQGWTVVPEFGKPIGYDLEKGDWVIPHGTGEIEDFVFLMNLNRKSMADAEASYILSFSNPLDGIQEYMPPKRLQSAYIFPYTAPIEGYEKSLYQHDINTPYGPSKTTEKDNVNYLFRVRTKTDDEGNIISACYGRISGEIKISRKGQVEFEYWFNPDPQSRSLESDKKPY